MNYAQWRQKPPNHPDESAQNAAVFYGGVGDGKSSGVPRAAAKYSGYLYALAAVDVLRWEIDRNLVSFFME